MKWLNKIRAMLLGACLTAASSASALTVYDPWNHLESIRQLAQQVQQVQQMITLVTDQKQLLSYAGLDQMKWVIDLVQVHQQQGTLGTLQSVLGQFYQQSQSASGAMEGIWREYHYSNVPSWDEYLAREQRIAEANHGVHTAAFQHATETLQGLDRQHQVIRDLSAKTDTSAGTQQLLQTIAKHTNLIATQNAQLLALIAQQRQEEADEKSQRDAQIIRDAAATKQGLSDSVSASLESLGRAFGVSSQ